jgi:phosphohistidine swiveling domain-containing protein
MTALHRGIYMTAITRINTTIGDNTIANSFLALCLVVSSALLFSVSINLAKTSYDTLHESVSTTAAVSTNEVQVTSHPSTAVISVSSDSPVSTQSTIAAQLQPAQNNAFMGIVTANTLQPSGNSVQLTDSNLQNATALLQ